jgi:N-formylglutamate amidohydrolase
MLINPERLLIHVPHASLIIPARDRSDFLISDSELLREARTSSDLHTDALARAAWPAARIIEAEVSRLVVDLERFEDDELEGMSVVGRGALYTRDHQGRRIRSDPSPERRRELLDRYYHPHWARLRRSARDAVLIDLHTYPKIPWPIERAPRGAVRPEIDLGFSSDLTPPGWVDALSVHFRDHGYEVGHNTPYTGVIDAGARAAVMIEIRRDRVGTPGQGQVWSRLIRALASIPVP